MGRDNAAAGAELRTGGVAEDTGAVVAPPGVSARLWLAGHRLLFALGHQQPLPPFALARE